MGIVSCRHSIKENMRLLGMKSLGLFISAALFLLVVGEASSAPTAESTTEMVVAASTAESTREILNSPLNRNAAPCHSSCFWNAKRGRCWYRRGYGRGRCLE